MVKILHVGYSLKFSDEALRVLATAGLTEVELSDIVFSPPHFAVLFYRDKIGGKAQQQLMRAWYQKRAECSKVGTLCAIHILRKKQLLHTCVCELSLDGKLQYVVLKNTKGRPLDHKRWANSHTKIPLERVPVTCVAYETKE